MDQSDMALKCPQCGKERKDLMNCACGKEAYCPPTSLGFSSRFEAKLKKDCAIRHWEQHRDDCSANKLENYLLLIEIRPLGLFDIQVARVLSIPPDVSMVALHRIICRAFGWADSRDSHFIDFVSGAYSNADPNEFESVREQYAHLVLRKEDIRQKAYFHENLGKKAVVPLPPLTALQNIQSCTSTLDDFYFAMRKARPATPDVNIRFFYYHALRHKESITAEPYWKHMIKLITRVPPKVSPRCIGGVGHRLPHNTNPKEFRALKHEMKSEMERIKKDTQEDRYIPDRHYLQDCHQGCMDIEGALHIDFKEVHQESINELLANHSNWARDERCSHCAGFEEWEVERVDLRTEVEDDDLYSCAMQTVFPASQPLVRAENHEEGDLSLVF